MHQASMLYASCFYCATHRHQAPAGVCDLVCAKSDKHAQASVVYLNSAVSVCLRGKAMVGRAQVEDLHGYVSLLVGTHIELSLFCRISKQVELTRARTAHLAACLCIMTYALLKHSPFSFF